MAQHPGHPSGVNKPKEGTGIPTKVNDENMKNDKDRTERYTDDDGEVADNVKKGHPNRNEDKGDATNNGGYRN